jgi:tol-pal system protein YbgF
MADRVEEEITPRPNARRGSPSQMNELSGKTGVAVLALGVLVAAAGCAGLTIPKKEAPSTEQEIAVLKGTVDELKKNQDTATQELAKVVIDLKNVRALLSQMTAAQEEREQNLRALKATLDRLSGQVEKLAQAPSSPLAGSPGTAQGRTKVVPASPEELYNSALSSYRARDLNAAVLKLFSFIDSYPTHRLAESAQFMLGDVYYAQGEYDLASEELLKYLDAYPKGPKAPEALLKLGLSYRALKDLTEARAVWRQLLRDFPRSDAAARARSLLTEGSRKGR